VPDPLHSPMPLTLTWSQKYWAYRGSSTATLSARRVRRSLTEDQHPTKRIFDANDVAQLQHHRRLIQNLPDPRRDLQIQLIWTITIARISTKAP